MVHHDSKETTEKFSESTGGTNKIEMVSFSSLTTVLDNNLPTFRLDALVVLKANEANVWRTSIYVLTVWNILPDFKLKLNFPVIAPLA